MAIINGQGRVGVRVTSGSSPVTPQYPSSLKLFIDAGNPLSYSGTGTTVTDLSGNGNNTTLVNGVGYSSSNGGILTFDGINDRVSKTGGVNTGQNFTVSAWIYPSLLGDVRRAIIGNSYPNTGRQGWLLCTAGGGRQNTFFMSVGADQAYRVAESYTLSVNTWQYITAVVTGGGSSIILYKNGVEITNYALSNLTSGTITYTDSEFYIGYRNSNLPDIYTGNISQVLIYDKALTSSEILQNFNEFKTRYGYLSDSDAAAFVSAAGITDSTQASAVNTLVTSLKSAGIWSKMKAIYPVVGGNATAHSKNLINPSQYQLTFSSGWVHSSTGMKPNGTSAYADTSINPNITMNLNDAGLGVYLRTNIAESGVDIGCQSSGTAYQLYIYSRYIDNNTYGAIFSDNHSISSTDSRGFFSINRGVNNIQKIFKNGTLIKTGSEITTQKVTNNIAIGAVMRDSNTQANFSSKENAFTYILNNSLTDSEISNLYTAVQAFQTTLGRQV